MSRGHGEVQRFILDHLTQASKRERKWDGFHTVRGITEAWVLLRVIREGWYEEPQPGYVYDIEDNMGDPEKPGRADTESVRRALKSLEREGLVKLYRHCMDCGADLLHAYLQA